jgi:hypothetical protein
MKKNHNRAYLDYQKNQYWLNGRKPEKKKSQTLKKKKKKNISLKKRENQANLGNHLNLV